MTKHFDPLDYENLGKSISRALDEQEIHPIEAIERFDGAGIYALYYTGDHGAYRPLSLGNQAEPGSWPIYIGKAEAESARKGDPEQAKKPVGPKLFNRILKHRKSIDCATNLEVSDFEVRALTIAPTWVPLAEVVSIRLHSPVWNVILDGLGNHDPGAGRYKGMRPRWDTLHPGRHWAPKLAARPETPDDLQNQVLAYLTSGVTE